MRGAVWLITFLLGEAKGGNILGIFPHSGLTHWLCFKPIMEELANRGHQVTVVSVFPRKEPLPNYTDISLEPSYQKAREGEVDLESSCAHSIIEMVTLYEMSAGAENTLKQQDVLALANQKFDLVITEFFHTDIYLALAHKINAPVIGVSSHQIMPWSSEALRNPDEPSYIPHSMSFLNAPFTFWQRLENTVTLHISQFAYKYIFMGRAQGTAETLLGTIPDLDDLTRNTSLLLTNSHFSINNPRPLNPNVIQIGGINVFPAKPLPQGLQELMDRSKEGVIYFSMGTVLKASTLSDVKRNAFLKTFAGLKQTVLWKWDGQLKDKPANVHIAPWFPQRDVFAHKNMVLFISHCGNLGVNEAVHEGLPIICIPMFGDQPYNSKSVESQGMAEVLDFYTDINYEKVKSTVNKVLTNPKYKRNARRVSKAYRDRPMTPLQTAIYWIEYVLRHEGAYHLRSNARNMPWYQYHNYDVYLLLHLVLLAVVYSMYKFLRGLLRFFMGLCSKSKPKQSSTKVKKS